MKRLPKVPLTEVSRPDLEQRALIAARALVDRMTVLYRELERMTDAPIALHRALTCIGGEPGIRASRLAELLGIQRSAVSHALKALAARGWIERIRSADDQRSVRLSVTPAGRAILNATSGQAVGTLQRGVRRLSQEQLSGLESGLSALLQHLPPAPVPSLRPRRTRREPQNAGLARRARAAEGTSRAGR